MAQTTDPEFAGVVVPGLSPRKRWCSISLIAAASAIMIAIFVPSTRRVAGSSAEEVVLLDFTATWCSPCQKVSPLIDQLEREGNTVRRVDVDQEPNIAARYQVKSVPTFVLTAGGQEVGRVRGADTDTEKKLRELLAKAPLAVRGQDPSSTRSDTPILAPFDPIFGGRIRLGSSAPFSSPGGSAQPSGYDQLGAVPRTAIPANLEAPLPSRHDAQPFVADNVRSEAPRRSASPGRSSRSNIVRGQTRDAADLDNLPLTPLAVSTRLRVREGSKHHFGSGTIIDNRLGQSVILTCGHILEGMERGEKLVVEVDVYDLKGQPTTFVGRVLGYDLEGDVGLIGINTTSRLPVAKLSAVQDLPAEGTGLVSIGCGGGDDPTEEKVSVTALNRYDGPDTIECTGLPRLGRSGGGLFRADQKLVGVSIAANQTENRGVYAGIGPIVRLIQKAGLADRILGNDSSLPDQSGAPDGSLAGTLPDPFPAGRAASLADTEPPRAFSQNPGPSVLEGLLPGNGEFDGEVICIVRSKDPSVPSRVIVIHDPQAGFMDSLMQEGAQPISNLQRRALEVVQEGQAKWGHRGSLVNRDEVARSRTSLTEDQSSSDPRALQSFGTQQ